MEADREGNPGPHRAVVLWKKKTKTTKKKTLTKKKTKKKIYMALLVSL